MVGERTLEMARRFRVSPARVSQLCGELCLGYLRFQGECPNAVNCHRSTTCAAIANLSDSLLVASAGSTLVVEHSAFTGNQAIGGNGAAGGNGGAGNGGAITNVGEGSTALVTHSTFTGKQALGGSGGTMLVASG